MPVKIPEKFMSITSKDSEILTDTIIIRQAAPYEPLQNPPIPPNQSHSSLHGPPRSTDNTPKQIRSRPCTNDRNAVTIHYTACSAANGDSCVAIRSIIE